MANFANASQLTTTVSFAAAGSYQLRLTADDGLLSSSDTLTVSVQPEPPPNQPPTVDAGSDMSVTLPSLLQLQGSVADDGQPLTATLHTTWSVSSGAGTVNFANRNALSTTAQFSSAGSYRLQLSANDGQFLRSDSVTVTVYPAPPVNQAPIVNAGSDLTVTLPAMATLTGSAQDDGLPVPASLATSWLLVNGPGSVIFGNQTSPTTTAQFIVAGSYLLHLTASDGDRSALDEVTITVLPVPPVNRAPNVWAGDDITLTLPASVPVSVSTTLVGQVSDDGLPQNGQLTIGWSVLSSSGAFSISHSSQVTTSLSFALPGNYLLQLTATDGELAASDEILITVNAEAEKNKSVFLPLVVH